MNPAIFYHAGCPVCAEAEINLAEAIDRSHYAVEIVHLGENPDRIQGAREAGVQSVPALVLNGAPFHINFGASLEDLEGGN